MPDGANYRWVILLITTVAQTAASLVTQGIPTLGPFFQKEFNMTRALVGTFVVLMNIGSSFTLAMAGKAVDRFGEKRVISLGGILLGLTVMAMICVNTLFFASILLFVLGFWYATATPGGSKAIMTWFSDRQRGMAMGIRQTGVPLGGMLAAIILPPLATGHGWRFALFIAGIVAILGAVACFFFYKEPPEQTRLKYHNISNSKVSTRQLLSDQSFLSVSILSIVLGASQSILISYLILYSMEVLNLPLATGSYLLVAAQVSGFGGRIIWGIISDNCFHGNRRKILMAISQVGAATIFVLAFLTSNSPLWFCGLLAAFSGFSAIGWNGIFITFVSELGGHDNAGSAVGLALTAAQVGYIFGPPLFGLCVDLTGSYRIAWLLLSGLLWTSLILFKFIKEPHQAIELKIS